MKRRIVVILIALALLVVMFGCGMSDPLYEIQSQCPEMGSCQYDWGYIEEVYGPEVEP